MRTLLLLIFSLILFPKDEIILMIKNKGMMPDYILYESGRLVYRVRDLKNYHLSFENKVYYETLLDDKEIRMLMELRFLDPEGFKVRDGNGTEFLFPQYKKKISRGLQFELNHTIFGERVKTIYEFLFDLPSDMSHLADINGYKVYFWEFKSKESISASNSLMSSSFFKEYTITDFKEEYDRYIEPWKVLFVDIPKYKLDSLDNLKNKLVFEIDKNYYDMKYFWPNLDGVYEASRNCEIINSNSLINSTLLNSKYFKRMNPAQLIDTLKNSD